MIELMSLTFYSMIWYDLLTLAHKITSWTAFFWKTRSKPQRKFKYMLKIIATKYLAVTCMMFFTYWYGGGSNDFVTKETSIIFPFFRFSFQKHVLCSKTKICDRNQWKDNAKVFPFKYNSNLVFLCRLPFSQRHIVLPSMKNLACCFWQL